LNVSLLEEMDISEPNSEQLYQPGSHDYPGYGISEARFQRIAFVHATYVYMYRTLLNVPPHAVQSYVAKTFENVSRFYETGGGTRNFSIWPAFIAAVEAYTEEDLSKARQWLDWATCFGLGSRSLARKVVEEVWTRRAALAQFHGVSPGEIIVDWRETMHELDCDILLV
jgi:hypothetical protein